MLVNTTTTAKTGHQTINIRPGVSILSVLRHLNYKPWFAIAEFVDNSIQSYYSHLDEIQKIEGKNYRLVVNIEVDPTDRGRIVIRDNAAGIHESNYARAFRPAELPSDRSGLSEFGMGMKSAACWFSSRWSVRTSALHEALEKEIHFDINTIVRDDIQELTVKIGVSKNESHFTEIILDDLHKVPHGKTISKIKDHLASIYRVFLRDNRLVLVFNGERLSYSDPKILNAPHYKDSRGESVEWKKKFNFDFGSGLRGVGFAAIRETASTSGAGFALFRRDRLIEGSVDEGYRPEFIFGKPNSYRYQRLFGEIHLEGFEVSHTKDGFKWNEYEDIFLEFLKEELNKKPVPLLEQAEEFRVKANQKELRKAAELATDRTAETLERELTPVLETQLKTSPESENPPQNLLENKTLEASREINVELNGSRWVINLELTNDESISEWITISDKSYEGANGGDRRVVVRVSLAHPFMVRFSGPDARDIEPLLRIAAAIGLAEVSARDSGVTKAGTIRRNINELLREALSKP